MARSGPFRLDLPAGPIVPGLTDKQVTAAWLVGEQPAPTPQPDDLTDDEVDALWTPRAVRATRPADGEQMHEYLFADTTATTPQQAKELGW